MDNEVIVIKSKSIFDVIQDAICDEDETLDGRFSAVEDAICELDEMLNGGE